MRLLALSSVILATGLLAACGGGGTPLASTPTPTPAPPTNSNLVNLQYSQGFEGRAAINPFSISKTNGAVTGGTGIVNRQIEIRYDASNQSYTVIHSDQDKGTFTPANRDAASSTSNITVYEKTSGNRTEDLILFNPGPANSQLALTYASYGAWQTITDTDSSLNVTTSFFVFGIPTTSADLPKTGSASYQTTVDGLFADNSGIYALGGSSSFTADFGAGTVSFDMAPMGEHILTGAFKDFGTVNGSGTISSQTSSFTASSGVREPGSYGISMLGKFYGPGAAEMGASFVLQGDTGFGNGVIIGKKD